MSRMLDRLSSIDERIRHEIREQSIDGKVEVRADELTGASVHAEQNQQAVLDSRIVAAQTAAQNRREKWQRARNGVSSVTVAARRFTFSRKPAYSVYPAVLLLMGLGYLWINRPAVDKPRLIAVAPVSVVVARFSAPVAMPQTETQIRQMVAQWAQAWSRRDASDYLSFYAADFILPEGLQRSGWEAQRKSRLNKYRSIAIGLSNVEIGKFDALHANVNFVQDFRADRYQELGIKKELILKNVKGRWLIEAEKSL